MYRLNIISYLPLKKYRLHIHTSKFNDNQLELILSDFFSEYFSKLLNPKALDRIQWHKENGHEIWVISASYDFLLKKWSFENKIRLITNRTVLKESRRYLIGEDVNYEAKLNYLKDKININDYSDIYAYGDSEGDEAILRIANFKFYKPFRDKK